MSILVLALIDKVATVGGKDSMIPEGESIWSRAGQGEPEIMTVSRVDEWERESCRMRDF